MSAFTRLFTSLHDIIQKKPLALKKVYFFLKLPSYIAPVKKVPHTTCYFRILTLEINALASSIVFFITCCIFSFGAKKKRHVFNGLHLLQRNQANDLSRLFSAVRI